MRSKKEKRTRMAIPKLFVLNANAIHSNHSSHIFKQLLKSISKRLSANWLSKEVFDKSKMIYKKSLNNSGKLLNKI